MLQFPYCDGSHNQHNTDTGDNIGPLILKTQKQQEEESTKKKDGAKKKKSQTD